MVVLEFGFLESYFEISEPPVRNWDFIWEILVWEMKVNSEALLCTSRGNNVPLSQGCCKGLSKWLCQFLACILIRVLPNTVVSTQENLGVATITFTAIVLKPADLLPLLSQVVQFPFAKTYMVHFLLGGSLKQRKALNPFLGNQRFGYFLFARGSGEGEESLWSPSPSSHLPSCISHDRPKFSLSAYPATST